MTGQASRRAARCAALLLCLLGLFLAAARPTSAAEGGALAINTADPAPLSRPDTTGVNDRIVAEAFRRIGVAARLVRLPAERAMQNADQGIDDGTYARIAGLERLYPNLIMVPEPVSEFLFTAFTKNPSLAVSGWEGLKPLHVGFITGWKIVEANTGGVHARTGVRDEAALFALLDSGRVEVVVLERLSGLETARSLGLAGVRALEPPLERRDMYLYLNRRHADLVPRLAEALRQMRRDGTIERLTKLGLGAGQRGGGQ